MTFWFRAYAETLNDPKVQTLPLDAFKAWHNALYLACSISSRDGNIGTIETVAFAFRETVASVSSAFHPLVEAGLLLTENETFHIASWRKRQFKSDTSTERVKRFRKRSRNVTETVPDTDTDTDTDKKKTIDKSIAKKEVFGSRLAGDFTMPPDWIEWAISERHWPPADAETEAANFIDYWHAKTGKDATKRDWNATWRNWVRNSHRIGVITTDRNDGIDYDRLPGLRDDRDDEMPWPC